MLVLSWSCQKNEPETTSSAKNNLVLIPPGAIEVSIVFGHNINGETHPCGCREHPLGGLPQVAGALHEIRQKNPVIYVDSGDMLFSANKMPSALQKSWEFTAENLVNAMNILKLNYAVPGDYDLTAGASFLKKLSSKMEYPYLIANGSKELQLGQKAYDIIDAGEAKIFFMGVVSPESLPHAQKKYFTDPYKALEKTYNEVKAKGYDPKNKRHFLILLSHSGIDQDEALALKFPNIDWIIGSHSQKFTQKPIKVGATSLVQVLSRNHYLGHIKLNLQDPERTSFDIIQTRDEMKDKAVPNPMISFLEKHKNKLQTIQFEEQEALKGQAKAGEKLPPAMSCMACHEAQGQKWHKTAHSLAMVTLINAQADKNPQCISCHSVGYGKKEGFQSLSELALVKVDKDPNKLTAASDLYWKEIKQIASKIDSVRGLSKAMRAKHAKVWDKTDRKHEIIHQFGNVQCLNCHDQSMDHPYDSKKKLSPAENKLAITAKCLECHNYDQSPKWYNGNDIKHTLNQKIFDSHYNQIKCPKYTE